MTRRTIITILKVNTSRYHTLLKKSRGDNTDWLLNYKRRANKILDLSTLIATKLFLTIRSAPQISTELVHWVHRTSMAQTGRNQV